MQWCLDGSKVIMWQNSRLGVSNQEPGVWLLNVLQQSVCRMVPTMPSTHFMVLCEPHSGWLVIEPGIHWPRCLLKQNVGVEVDNHHHGLEARYYHDRPLHMTGYQEEVCLYCSYEDISMYLFQILKSWHCFPIEGKQWGYLNTLPVSWFFMTYW